MTNKDNWWPGRPPNRQQRSCDDDDRWYMPDDGESIQQLLESEVLRRQSGASGAPTGSVHEPGPKRGGGPIPGSRAVPEAFAADVDPETAAVMAATQRPWS